MNKLCYYTFIVFGSSFGSASPSSSTEDWDGGVMTLFNTFFQMETIIISSIFSVIAIDNNTTIIHLSLSLCERFSYCVYYTYQQNNHASLADNSGNKNNNNEKKTKVKVLKHTKWFSYVFSSSVFVIIYFTCFCCWVGGLFVSHSHSLCSVDGPRLYYCITGNQQRLPFTTVRQPPVSQSVRQTSEEGTWMGNDSGCIQSRNGFWCNVFIKSMHKYYMICMTAFWFRMTPC